MEKAFLVTAFTTGQILKCKEVFSPPRKLQVADAQKHSTVRPGMGWNQRTTEEVIVVK